MSRKITHAQKDAQIAALEAALEERTREVAALRRTLRHDYIERSEYNRVQGVLRTTQQFLAKYKRQAQGARPASDFAAKANARREAARALASELGRTVTRDEVDAYLAR